MLFQLFLLFTLGPVFELWLLIQVGGLIGPLQTLLLVIITGAVGAYFTRQQGLKVLTTFQSAVQRGEMPTDIIIEGLMVLVGGALLVTPGIATDFFGFALVFPATRKPIRLFLQAYLIRNFNVVTYSQTAGGQSFGQKPPASFSNDDDVIDV